MNSSVVLVVEDDATLARAITRNLTVRGYDAPVASTVGEAIGSIRERCPDLLVLDIDLPDGSGWDVARELRTRSGEAPIVVISALRANHSLLRELSCVGSLEKPFPMDALVRAVEQSLTKYHAGSA